MPPIEPSTPRDSGFEWALLVVDTRAFVEEWRRYLVDGASWDAERIALLRERSKTLQMRARTTGIGGLVHHLTACDECVHAESVERERLEQCLRNVSELAVQLEQEFEPRPALTGTATAEPSAVAPVAAPALPVAAAALPAVMTVAAEAVPEDAPAAVAAPVATPAAPAVGAEAAVEAPLSPAASEIAAPTTDAAGAAPEERLGAAAPAVSVEAVSMEAVSVEAQAPAQAASAQVVPAEAVEIAPVVAAAPAVAVEAAAREPARAAHDAAPQEPAEAPLEFHGLPPPVPASPPWPSPALLAASTEPDEAIAALCEVLGVPIGAAARARAWTAPAPDHLELAPPRADAFLGPSGEPGGDGVPQAEGFVEPAMAFLLERRRPTVPYPWLADTTPPAEPLSGPDPRHFHSEARVSGRALRWAGPLALGVLGIVALVLRWPGRDGDPSEAKLLASPAGALSGARGALLPPPRLTEEAGGVRALLAQAHAHGGPESPELSELLEQEAALFGRSWAEPCAPGSSSCAALDAARELSSEGRVERAAARPGPLGSWLADLRVPEIGVQDDDRVRHWVAFHTRDPVGREQFQNLLFRCAAHQGSFRRAVQRQALPRDLVALVMVESGCAPDAQSPQGERGLWQLTPTAARAYHLRVQPGIIDERLSPHKSTEAGLHLLADLYRKLQSWDLALASYDLGPFRLLARLRQAGGTLGFADLAAAGWVPGETAAYVAKIQAFSLILANLEHFRFVSPRQRSGESAAALRVPGGTRLSLVARAAASSTSKIRELNPDLLADTVPGRGGESFEVRVPRARARKAQRALERLTAKQDRADECVPHHFDWGRQRFTSSMWGRCRLSLAAAR